jgi:hypothetical protein
LVQFAPPDPSINRGGASLFIGRDPAAAMLLMIGAFAASCRDRSHISFTCQGASALTEQAPCLTMVHPPKGGVLTGGFVTS